MESKEQKALSSLAQNQWELDQPFNCSKLMVIILHFIPYNEWDQGKDLEGRCWAEGGKQIWENIIVTLQCTRLMILAKLY